MRILVVTNMYPPHHFGGYELSCADAVRRFRQAGHEVGVLTSDIRVEGASGGDGGGVRRRLRIYWQDHRVLDPSPLRSLGMELANQRALRAALADLQPDVVSVWNMGAMSLGLLSTLRRRGLPVVFVLGDDWPNYAPLQDAWSRRFRGRRRSRAGALLTRLTGLPTVAGDFSDLGPVLFNSAKMLADVERGGAWAMPQRAIVYTGVEPEDFPIPADDDPLPDRPWRGRLLYVGRIDERKGTATIVRALPLLAGARLRIVGRGDAGHLAELRALAGRLGVEERVEILSRPRAELRAEYAAADALVFSSVYDEPFGIVPLEAMSTDTPVVATGTGGSGEYLRDGWNCLLYPPGDERGLSAALRRLAASGDLRRRLAANGRRTARGLTTEAWMESLMAWHSWVAGGRRGPPPPDRRIELGGSEQ